MRIFTIELELPQDENALKTEESNDQVWDKCMFNGLKDCICCSEILCSHPMCLNKVYELDCSTESIHEGKQLDNIKHRNQVTKGSYTSSRTCSCLESDTFCSTSLNSINSTKNGGSRLISDYSSCTLNRRDTLSIDKGSLEMLQNISKNNSLINNQKFDECLTEDAEENYSRKLSSITSEKLPTTCDYFPDVPDEPEEINILNEDDKRIYLKFKEDLLRREPFGENILKVLDDINDLYFSILSNKYYPCECKYRNTIQDSNEDAQIYTRVSDFVRLQKYQQTRSSSKQSSTVTENSDIQMEEKKDINDSSNIVNNKNIFNCLKNFQILIKFPVKPIITNDFIVSFEIFNMDLERIKWIRVETYVICSLGIALKVLALNRYDVIDTYLTNKIIIEQHEAFYSGKNSIFGCVVECMDSLKHLVVFSNKEADISLENTKDKERQVFSLVEIGINNESSHKGHKYVPSYVSPNEITTEEISEN